MPKRASRRSPDLRPEAAVDVERAVISVAARDPVDVPKALRRVRAMKADEERAVALVDMALDVDAATIIRFLDAMTQITDETWRARTIFSAFQQADLRFARELPARAQEMFVALVEGIASDIARAAMLRNLPSDLPIALRDRLAGVRAPDTERVCRPTSDTTDRRTSRCF